MNILIVGMGEVGYHVAKVLSEAKHSVTVVDPDPAKIRRASEVLDVQTLQGDGTLPHVLDEADAASMDLLLATKDWLERTFAYFSGKGKAPDPPVDLLKELRAYIAATEQATPAASSTRQ